MRPWWRPLARFVSFYVHAWVAFGLATGIKMLGLWATGGVNFTFPPWFILALASIAAVWASEET